MLQRASSRPLRPASSASSSSTRLRAPSTRPLPPHLSSNSRPLAPIKPSASRAVTTQVFATPPPLRSSLPTPDQIARKSSDSERRTVTTSAASPKQGSSTADSSVAGSEAALPRPVGIKLRPYQTECIRAVLDELERGQHQRLGVSAPTGSGKTAIFTSLIRYLPPLIHPTTGEHATRVLIIVNSIQLATQTAEVVKRTYPGLSVDVEQGNKRGNGMAEVTVATYQTLARGELSRLDKYDPDYLKAVIVDEAHHAIAPSYLAILSRFDSHILDEASRSSITVADSSIPASAHIKPAPGSPSGGEARTEVEEVDLPDDLSFSSPSELFPQPAPRSSSSESQISEETSSGQSEEEEDPFNLLPDPVPREAILDSRGRHRVPLLAFSATWGRADGLALGKVWEKIVWHSDWLDMIEGSWLSPIRFTTVHLGNALDLSQIDVSSSSGEFTMTSLANAVDKYEVNKVAVDAWEDKAGDRRSTLVFAVNIAHVVSLTNEFRARGIDARFVYEATKQREREELYRGFRAGDFPVLVNCGILLEGVDFPFVDCVLFARPTRSQNLFLQMLGRGLRLSPDTGKQDCLLLDLVGNSANAGGVVCTPTLFGLDPEERIDGQTTAEMQDRSRAREQAQADSSATVSDEPVHKLSAAAFANRHNFHYRDYSTAFDLVAQTKKKTGETQWVGIERLSRLAWVGVGEDTWILELMGVGHVKIVKEGEDYRALLYRRIPPTPGLPRYLKPHLIASHRSFPILLRTTDAFILHDPKYASVSLARHHSWRRLPATDAQKTYILKKLAKDSQDECIEGVWVGKPHKEWVKVDGLTKGQASDILARAVHGGSKYWRDAKKVIRKEEKKEEKVQKQLAKVRGIKFVSKAAE
ncbi:hypothetical protein JCM11641_007071 [Rhodosporidiobolus odoratus]